MRGRPPAQIGDNDVVKRVALLIVFAGLSMTEAFAQAEIAGEWAVTFASPSGPQEFTMYVMQEGPRLTGRLTNDSGEFPLKGTFDGKSFNIVWSLPDKGKMLEITFTGTVEGDAMSGTAKLGTGGSGPLSGTRTGS